MSRTTEIARTTKETDIKVRIDLDGTGANNIDTGIGFFDHMLTALSKHSGIDMDIVCEGDLKVDDHHSVPGELQGRDDLVHRHKHPRSAAGDRLCPAGALFCDRGHEDLRHHSRSQEAGAFRLHLAGLCKGRCHQEADCQRKNCFFHVYSPFLGSFVRIKLHSCYFIINMINVNTYHNPYNAPLPFRNPSRCS